MVAPVVYSWTGCYIGGNVGVATTRQDQFRTAQDTIGPVPADYGSESDSSIAGGGQIGCDYQSGSWLFGGQVQWDWTNMNGSHALPAFPTFTMFDQSRWFGTVTGRVGFLPQPNVLLYVKGGAAWINDNDYLNQPNGQLSESASWTKSGWTIGGGVEWRFVQNWSVFVEANYMDFGSTSIHFIAPPGLFPPGETISVNQNQWDVLVGVNYRFNWGGPVVAKY